MIHPPPPLSPDAHPARSMAELERIYAAALGPPRWPAYLWTGGAGGKWGFTGAGDRLVAAFMPWVKR